MNFGEILIHCRVWSTVQHTVCPESSAPFYIETYYIKWVTTSWTHSINSQHSFNSSDLNPYTGVVLNTFISILNASLQVFDTIVISVSFPRALNETSKHTSTKCTRNCFTDLLLIKKTLHIFFYFYKQFENLLLMKSFQVFIGQAKVQCARI